MKIYAKMQNLCENAKFTKMQNLRIKDFRLFKYMDTSPLSFGLLNYRFISNRGKVRI